MAEKPKAGEMRKRNFEKINSVLPRLHKAINSNVYDKKDVQYKPVSCKVSNKGVRVSKRYKIVAHQPDDELESGILYLFEARITLPAKKV